MSEALQELAAARAELPVFPGLTLRDQVVFGAGLAEEVLRSVTQIELRIEKAEEALKIVDEWQSKHAAELTQVLQTQSSESALPEYLRLKFGPELAQNYIIGCFLLAKRGLAPWLSGRMVVEASSPQGALSDADARADAASRLRTFGCIVRMKDSGYLDQVFLSPGSLQGFGLVPAVGVAIAVVVGVVLVASVWLVMYFQTKQLEEHNKIVASICDKAIAENDTATVKRCLEIAHENQTAIASKPDPVSSIVSTAAKLALVGGLIYGAVHLWPYLRAPRSRGSEERTV